MGSLGEDSTHRLFGWTSRRPWMAISMAAQPAAADPCLAGFCLAAPVAVAAVDRPSRPAWLAAPAAVAAAADLCLVARPAAGPCSAGPCLAVPVAVAAVDRPSRPA